MSHPNHRGEGGSALPGDSVSDPSSEEVGGGGVAAPRDLLGSPRSSETKGTLWHRPTHPWKHYFLSHQLQHPPHMSRSLPRTESLFFNRLTVCSRSRHRPYSASGNKSQWTVFAEVAATEFHTHFRITSRNICIDPWGGGGLRLTIRS